MPIEEDQHFVTESDWVPSFWNYLLDLNATDLVAELVQNDVDQGATRTVVSFEKDYLVCEGNGNPVEPDGWRRLRLIQGAGDTVPAKKGKIGVKNHGLKTAFSIGDELSLMSAGKIVKQTLYANGRSKPPYPGAYSEPKVHPEAPSHGCKIIIRYRSSPVEPREGEANVIGAVDGQEIDALFLQACQSAPEQFAGVVSPESLPKYVIELRHWFHGVASFSFSCTRPRRIKKGIELFRRSCSCSVKGTVSKLPKSIHESAARRLVPLRGRLKDRVADFYKRGNYYFVEVSWPTNPRGRPIEGTGRFRYPIGYPNDSVNARTGYNTYFNVPIASDNKRYEPARNEATNDEIRRACESLLVDVLAVHAIPKWGFKGLNLLVPSLGADNQDEAVRPLLDVLVEKNALPTLTWRQATELVFKGKRDQLKSTFRGLGSAKEARRYQFVVPTLTWSKEKVHPALAMICPRNERQLDPRIPAEIIKLLADRDFLEFAETFVTFDENDAFDRVVSDGNKWFGSICDRASDFSQPMIARAYLDLFEKTIKCGNLTTEQEDELIEHLLLPDSNGIAKVLGDLHSSALLPCDIPGLVVPAVLHSELVAHPLFRRTKWKRPKFTLADFLKGDSFRAADENTRKSFWNWLRQNECQLRPREIGKLAGLAIWPDEKGELCELSQLCEPRSNRLRQVLADCIRRPHKQVRESKLISARSKSGARLRPIPSIEEINSWLERRIAQFRIGEMADTVTRQELRRFEDELTILMNVTATSRLLKEIEITLPALAQDGSIMERHTLVMPGTEVGRLLLPKRFVLSDRRHASTLNKLSSAMTQPSALMILHSFTEDPGSFSALHPRLLKFLQLTNSGDAERIRIANLPIIPVEGRGLPPSKVAFRGGGADYWGGWKIRLSPKGLSQDDQARYRSVGVTSAVPSIETSQAFFEWLSGQNSEALEDHITCVLHHVHHRYGPKNWGGGHTDTPFIPVRGADGLSLVSLRRAREQAVYLSDAGGIGESIIGKDTRVRLVVDSVREVTNPITEVLRNLGVRSLREAIGEPDRVTCRGSVSEVGESTKEAFRELLSRDFQRKFRKHLIQLGVQAELLRDNWHDRLRRVRKVRISEQVDACFRFRRRTYKKRVAGGFDAQSGTLWLESDAALTKSTLYEIVAKQLVFKPEARPIDLFALERAITLEITEHSFGRRAGVGGPDAEMDAEQGVDEDMETGEDTTEIGEAISGHSPFEPDPARNVPNPSAFPLRPTRNSRPAMRRRVSTGSRVVDGRSNQSDEPEKEHIDSLKRQHYATHCQVCLCERPPSKLAPEGSYIEAEEVRRKVVEAHHVDLQSAGGARHAGNLVLLCKLHHDNLGRRLTRPAITEALLNHSKEQTITFGVDTDLKGQVIRIAIPDTGETIGLFFTDDHAQYWLERAH